MEGSPEIGLILSFPYIPSLSPRLAGPNTESMMELPLILYTDQRSCSSGIATLGHIAWGLWPVKFACTQVIHVELKLRGKRAVMSVYITCKYSRV